MLRTYLMPHVANRAKVGKILHLFLAYPAAACQLAASQRPLAVCRFAKSRPHPTIYAMLARIPAEPTSRRRSPCATHIATMGIPKICRKDASKITPFQ